MTEVVVAKNTRYDLNPARVQALIARQIANLEAQRALLKVDSVARLGEYAKTQADGSGFRNSRPPAGPGYVDPMVDDFCHRQATHFALVRVLEMPAESGKFFLVYGDVADDDAVPGTGPFPKFEDAAQFFYLGGR